MGISVSIQLWMSKFENFTKNRDISPWWMVQWNCTRTIWPSPRKGMSHAYSVKQLEEICKMWSMEAFSEALWRFLYFQKLCFAGNACSKRLFALRGWFCAFLGDCLVGTTDAVDQSFPNGILLSYPYTPPRIKKSLQQSIPQPVCLSTRQEKKTILPWIWNPLLAVRR